MVAEDSGDAGLMADSLYDSLYRDIASMPQGGQGGMPARKAEKPGLLDYVWGVAAGYNPNDIRRGFESREQQAMGREQTAAQITDPRERALFLDLGGDDWKKNVAQQFAPSTTSAGGRTDILGTGKSVAAPSFSTVGDNIYQNNPLTGTSNITATAPPSYSAQTARFNAENPVIPANATWVDATGKTRAQGRIAPEIVSTPAGGATNVFDADGNLINTVQGNPTQPRGAGGAQSFDATTRGALQKARDAASLYASRAADARRFIELNKKAGTGLGAALLGPAAGLNPTYAEMRAISARLIPQEREPGSGTMSDRDVALYGRAVLDVDKPGEANQAMAGVIVAQAQRAADYAAFMDEYATRNGNLNGAQEDWAAYANANPLFEERGGNTTVRQNVQAWRTFMGWGERQRGGAGRGGQGGASPTASGPIAVNPTTGARVQWNGSAWVPL